MESLKDLDSKKNKIDQLWIKLRRVLVDNVSFQSTPEQIELNLFQKTFVNEGKSIVSFIKQDQPEVSVSIYQQQYQIDKQKLFETFKKGLDNTGNTKIWPSEELLAFFCLKNCSAFINKSVIELGAGYSGLAGLALKKLNSNICLSLTDGNDDCVERLKKNVELNFGNDASIKIEKLIWNESFVSSKKFDIIIMADCLFFSDYHIGLIHTLHELMDKNSEAWIIAPERSHTLSLFLERIKSYPFTIEKMGISNLDEEIKTAINGFKNTIDQYNEDEHEFFLLKIRLLE